MDFCYHKDELKRAITVTTSVAELNWGIKEKKYKLLQLCELYAYEKGVHLFKDFVKNIEEFKGTLSDPTMIKFIKSGLNKSYGYFMLKNSQEKHKLCATLSDFQNLLDNNNVTDFDPIGNHYLDVCFESKSPSGTNCYSNLSIGIHILAYSRMTMDQ